MADRIILTLALIKKLKSAGYTHFQLRGIDANDENKKLDFNHDNYILVPWKKGITVFEDSNLQLEVIDSTDIIDMLDVEFGVSFWVELPTDIKKM